MPVEMTSLLGIVLIAGVLFAALLTVGMIFARLYRRASKEVSFVRTGFGGQKVIMNGGAMVLPVLHETIPVNMNTLRLEVRRANEQALITKDRMRVDVQAEFYVRVQPTIEAIANAAQTLGRRTMEPQALKELIEGKFVDSLRAVAAEMAMEELYRSIHELTQLDSCRRRNVIPFPIGNLIRGRRCRQGRRSGGTCIRQRISSGSRVARPCRGPPAA